MVEAVDSSTLVWVCWMATGNMPASMMKPMPRRITANMTSVKVKPRRFAERTLPSLDLCLKQNISFTSDQRSVVTIHHQGNRILVQPFFFLLLGARIAGERLTHGIVETGAAGLGIFIGETLALE